MNFFEIVDRTLELLQRKGRVSYRALKREFDLDDESLEDLKVELIQAQKIAVDEDGAVLVWVGASPVPGSRFQVPSFKLPIPSPQHPAPKRRRKPKRVFRRPLKLLGSSKRNRWNYGR